MTARLINYRSGSIVSMDFLVGPGQDRTNGKDGAQKETTDEEREANEELTILADGGEEWLARCGVPDLVK